MENLQLQLSLLMFLFFSCVFSDPIDSIHLYSVRPEDIGDESKYIEHEDGEDVTIQAGDQFYFRCVARSSNPPANVRVLIGDRDITDKVPFEWVFSGIRESVDIHIAFGISYCEQAFRAKLISICYLNIFHTSGVCLHQFLQIQFKILVTCGN